MLLALKQVAEAENENVFIPCLLAVSVCRKKLFGRRQTKSGRKRCLPEAVGLLEMTRLLNVVSDIRIMRPPLHRGLYNVNHFKQTRASFYKHVLLDWEVPTETLYYLLSSTATSASRLVLRRV